MLKQRCHSQDLVTARPFWWLTCRGKERIFLSLLCLSMLLMPTVDPPLLLPRQRVKQAVKTPDANASNASCQLQALTRQSV